MLSDYLVEFSVVVQQGTIAKAAERLNLSQSTLTRHLATLESTLDAKLMDRSTTGVRLTEDGRFVYDAALQIVSLGEGLVQRLNDWENEVSGKSSHLIIGGLSGLKSISKAFETACVHLSTKGYDVSLQYLPPRTPLSVKKSLDGQEMDVLLTFPALAQRLENVPGLRQEKLFDIPVVAIMKGTHPLAKAATLTQHDLKDATFARIAGMSGNMDVVWDEFVRKCEAKGFSPLYHMVSYGSAASGGQSDAESIVIQVDESLYTRQAHEQRRIVMPVADLFFQVVAITLDDNQSAIRFLDEARRLP
jgi:DNA-binding transcriptional LysR family regulator